VLDSPFQIGFDTSIMSLITPSPDFIAIAKQVVDTDKAHPMSKQDLRVHFGNVTKLGRRIKDDISRELRKLKVTTEPSFRGKDVQEFNLIKSRPRPTRQSGPTNLDAQPIVPEQDENGGDLGELSIANQFPCYVLRESDPKVLFQRLVESGKRGLVLVVEKADLPQKQGELADPVLRRPVGVVTWESYSQTIVNMPGNEGKDKLVMPSPLEAMNKDIALAYGTDDLIHSLQRIEKQGVLVVLNSNETVAGIATKRDIHNELAEELIPYQLIGLIENLLRSKIEEADFPAEVFVKASNNPDTTSVDKLEFSNYVGIFASPDNFRKLKVHGAAKEMGQLLNKVRILRNHLMHFNQEDEVDYAAELKGYYEAIRKLLKDE
jgi:hypothetical protein